MGIEKTKRFLPGIPCLVCGVDSGPIRFFLLTFFGGFFLASLSVALWAYFSGRMENQESSGSLALEAEKQGETK